jgi:hypothetical protein
MSRGYMIVEGHGEVRAAANLVTRLWRDLGLDPQFHWADMPIRGKAIHTREGVTRACSLVRTNSMICAGRDYPHLPLWRTGSISSNKTEVHRAFIRHRPPSKKLNRQRTQVHVVHVEGESFDLMNAKNSVFNLC